MENTELFLRSIVETANEAIIKSDSGGNITSWNQAAVDIFGYSHDEIMGKPVITIMPQRFHVAHRKGMRRVTTTGESHIIGSTVEVLGLRKDRTEIPLELSLAKWTIKDGQFFTAIIHDITERKRAEEALVETGAHIGEAIIMLQDTETTKAAHVFANQEWVRITGYTVEELKEISYWDLVHPRDRDAVAYRVQRRLHGESLTGYYEITIIKKDGREVPVEVAVGFTITYNGKPASVGYIRDITVRKQAEEAIREREEKFSRAFHSNPHPMSIVTLAGGHYLDVNDSYAQTFGFSREELLGRTTVEMGILKNDSTRRKLLQSLEERQTIKNLEVEFHTRSGRKVETLLSADKIEIGGQTCLLSVITDITERKRMLKEVRTLSGLLPICAWCKKLRDDEGYWKSVEQYIGERTKAEFTHGMCPECQSKFLSERNSNTKVS